MMEIYDPSVTGLPIDHDDYMGDEFVCEGSWLDCYPEKILFLAIKEAMNSYYFIFQILLEDKLDDKLQFFLARELVTARTAEFVMRQSKPSVLTIDNICFRLWPEQPRFNYQATLLSDDISASSAPAYCYWAISSIVERFFSLLQTPKNIGKFFQCATCSEIKSLLPAIFDKKKEEVLHSYNCNGLRSEEDYYGREPLHEKVMFTLERLYFIDTYGPDYEVGGNQANPTSLKSSFLKADFSQQAEYSKLLSLDGKRRTAKWDGKLIPLNSQNEYNVFACVADNPGVIISFMEIEQIMQGDAGGVECEHKLIKILKASNPVRTLVCRINKCLLDASVPLKLKATSSTGYKLIENTQTSAEESVVSTV